MNEVMKTKAIILGLGLIGIGGVGIFMYYQKRKPEPKKVEEKKEVYIPNTPEALLKRLMERILEENAWRNEREFLSTLSKLYLKEAKDITWIDYLPVSQEGMMETLNEIGLIEEYEKRLEEKYRRG